MKNIQTEVITGENKARKSTDPAGTVLHRFFSLEKDHAFYGQAALMNGEWVRVFANAKPERVSQGYKHFFKTRPATEAEIAEVMIPELERRINAAKLHGPDDDRATEAHWRQIEQWESELAAMKAGK